MANLSLRMKLLVAVGVMAVLLAVVGGVGVSSLRDVSHKYDHVASINLPNTQALGEMFAEYRRIRIQLRTLGLAGLTPEEARAAIAATEESIKKYEAADKRYNDVPFQPGEEAIYNRMNESWKAFRDLGLKVIGLYQSGNPEDRNKMVQIFHTTCPELAAKFTVGINELLAFHQKDAVTWVGAAKSSANQATTVTWIFTIGGVLGAALAGFVFASALSRRLDEITRNIGEAANQTASVSSQLSNASQQLSSGATETAASLEETTASLEELSSMVKVNADHAREAGGLSGQSRQTAQDGEQQIQRLISAMSEMAQSSKKIEEIINVIDDIAFQTNLLALNAAVEAARAGEQGKGFAVVADAVRSLAQRSAGAAKEISALIKDTVQKTDAGTQVADESGRVLKEIVTSVKKVADLNGEIASGTGEQTKGIQQISQAMNQLDQTAQSNASSAEEMAASAEEMSSQAQLLQRAAGELQEIVRGVRSTSSV